MKNLKFYPNKWDLKEKLWRAFATGAGFYPNKWDLKKNKQTKVVIVTEFYPNKWDLKEVKVMAVKFSNAVLSEQVGFKTKVGVVIAFCFFCFIRTSGI